MKFTLTVDVHVETTAGVNPSYNQVIERVKTRALSLGGEVGIRNENYKLDCKIMIAVENVNVLEQ